MPTKLNQLIAVAQGKKSHAKSVETSAYHIFQKNEEFNGLERHYRPKDEDGDKLPGESKHVRFRVNECVDVVMDALVEMFDVVASQDEANCHAKADVVVDGVVLLRNVPAVTLIFLEKQLKDFRAFISKVPVLEATESWKYDQNADLHVTDPVETVKTVKVQEPIVLYHATEEHPAQTQLITKDVVAGYWTQRKYSSAWSTKYRNEVLNRIRILEEAVVKAREEANSQEVKDVNIGKAVFDYLLSKNRA